MENYRVTREHIQVVLEFAACSTEPPVRVGAVNMLGVRILFDHSAPYPVTQAEQTSGKALMFYR